jgi:DNA-3-methyladenine glycosylase
LGIHRQHNGRLLTETDLYIVDDVFKVLPTDIFITQRIGVDYPGEDALLPYRFFLKNNPYVSGKKR